MYKVIYEKDQKVPIKIWQNDENGNQVVPIDENAIQQLKNISRLPFIHKHVAVMADCHVGKGSTIGSVIPTIKAIIPAAAGVDLGCGMNAIQTNIKGEHLPDSLSQLRNDIESSVPHGRTNNGGEGDRGAWHDIPYNSDFNFRFFHPWINNSSLGTLEERLEIIVNKHDRLERPSKRAIKHLGTLGTGNHFIELCLDENNNVWIMLHSGSRGIGNAIGTYFIEKAKEEMIRWNSNIPDIDLAFLPEESQYFDDYVDAISWAQDYAKTNREVMMKNVINVLNKHFPFVTVNNDSLAISCHHNYVEKENHFGKNVYVTRKGAVRARKDELGIIPGSMGTKSFIVRGKGNYESFQSCSHGAGRVLGRNQANKTITLEQHIKDTEGVECRKDMDVIDESPACYKNIEKVMEAQSDLVEIVHTLKQILVVKG